MGDDSMTGNEMCEYSVDEQNTVLRKVRELSHSLYQLEVDLGFMFRKQNEPRPIPERPDGIPDGDQEPSDGEK